MNRQISHAEEISAASRAVRLVGRFLPPLVTALIVLLLGLIGMILT